MTSVWVTIALLAVATAVIRAAGPVLVGGRDLHPRLYGVIALLAPALLAALVAVETFGRPRRRARGRRARRGVAAAGARARPAGPDPRRDRDRGRGHRRRAGDRVSRRDQRGRSGQRATAGRPSEPAARPTRAKLPAR